jgi:DNA-binding MarR family transcriptional regulator
LEGTSYRELRLLEEVGRTPDVSQRKLSYRLDIALGVANLLVRKLAKQGYIRVIHLSWKRWAYVVTPAGMTRKLQLTVAYIERFVDHYRRVRHMLREDLSSLTLNKESRVAIVGTTELAELAFLALRDIGVDDIEVFEPNPTKTTFLGFKIQELASIVPSGYAKIVIADSADLDNLRLSLVTSGVSDSQVVELLQQRRQEPGDQRQDEAS